MNCFDLETGKCLGTFPEQYLPPVPTSGESGLETPRHREFQQARRECGGICNSGYPSTSSGQARIKNAATVSWRGKQPEGGEVLCVVPSPLSLSIPPREVLRDFFKWCTRHLEKSLNIFFSFCFLSVSPCLRGKSFPFCCGPVNKPY
jgi:hypothetical protein